MKRTVIIIAAVITAALVAGYASAQQRWEGSGTPPPAEQKAQAAPAPAPSTPSYPPPPAAAAPAHSKAGCKSDLPGVPCEETVVPPGAVRLEDVKAGTKPKPATGEATPVPAPAPAPAAKAPAAAAEPAPARDPNLYDTRNLPATPPPGYQQPTTVQTTTKGYAPAKTQPSAPVAATGGCKSDLPNVPCEPAAVPPGAVRLEDVKPGTKAKPQPLSAPPSAPAQPSTIYGGHKSDLPGGWDEPTQVPPGAVRLEDVKAGTRPAQAGAQPQAPQPAAQPTPPRQSGIQEVPAGPGEAPDAQGKQNQRWQ